tara:strand:+ start:31809 stop:32066 length:258 start_codon:yes stop_codon:yes gene_type:complete
MGKDKVEEKVEALETVASGLKKFLVEFECKQIVRSTVEIEASTRTDAEKRFKADADNLDIDTVISGAKDKFAPQLVGKSVRAFPA